MVLVTLVTLNMYRNHLQTVGYCDHTSGQIYMTHVYSLVDIVIIVSRPCKELIPVQ